MIPEQTLREIQERLDIVEVIGGYLALRKAGRNFKALCPFHPEKTPSFMVYPHKQFFICYGCGAGGDLIGFVMKHEHLEFTEAVELLAQKAGVVVEVRAGGGAKPQPELYEVHAVAARFYHEHLIHAAQAQRARDYLGKRGVSPETWEAFQIGYAPDRWEAFLSHAVQQGFSPEMLERAGLAVSKEGQQRWFDRFRSRVMFPIWDSRGRVIAFGGRILPARLEQTGAGGEEAVGPKYMNSPETELYVKGRVLYGLHLAVPAIREKDFCIVVEGYLDLVSSYQRGIRNIVASMGTSLTETQVKLIRRHTAHVVMVYDGDYAGEMATLRGLDLFLEAQMRVKVAALAAGTDPDSLIQSRGVEAFAQAIRDSKDLFDYKLELLMRRFDAKELSGRVQISQEMLPTIGRVPNAIQRGEYIRRLGEALGVPEPLLWTELSRIRQGGSSWQPKRIQEMPVSGPGAGMSAEGLLAGLLLEAPERIRAVAGRLDPEGLQDSQVRSFINWLLACWQGGGLAQDPQALRARVPREPGDLGDRIARWLAWADSVVEKDEALEEVLDRIEKNRHRDRQDHLLSRLQAAERAGDERAVSELILEYNRLLKERPLARGVRS